MFFLEKEDENNSSLFKEYKNPVLSQDMLCQQKIKAKLFFTLQAISYPYADNCQVFISTVQAATTSEPPAMPLVKTMLCPEFSFDNEMSLESVVALMLVSAPTCV